MSCCRKFCVQPVKILRRKFAQSKINIRLERNRKCDDALARYWEKNKKLQKKIVLHPYPMPITDPTRLLKVSVFLYRISQNVSLC